MPTDLSVFDSPRAKLLLAVVGVLVVVQMVALYLLCDGQMSRARDRQAALDQQQLAINDCLQYAPDMTIGGCMQRAVAQAGKASPIPRGTAALAAAPAVLTTAMPVNFTYR